MPVDNDKSQGDAQVTKRSAIDIELDALAVIVRGFEALPAEARSRTYSYLIARFPQERIIR